jgi:FtsP/CotA-like multicopper oxidase with cupredoxin domain
LVLAGQSIDRLLPAQPRPQNAQPANKADYTLRIEPSTLEIGAGITVKTLAYNGKVPGPLLRLREGVPVTIDVTNAGPDPDIVHWHGLAIDSLNDGAMEEGSPMIEPGKTHRYAFSPRPSGTRWYHTHASANGNLAASTYTGQFGFLLIEGNHQQVRYDREINLAIHHW